MFEGDLPERDANNRNNRWRRFKTRIFHRRALNFAVAFENPASIAGSDKAVVRTYFTRRAAVVAARR
jgi:hypothetical protein